jgi:hypothetical protein
MSELTQRRGWHRPVKPVALLLVSAGVLLVWLALLVVTVWYVYERWEAHVTLRQQAVLLRLPAGMQAQAQVQSPLRTTLNLRPWLHVPIKQELDVALTDHLQAQVQLHAVLPVHTQVVVDQMVLVRTTMALSLKIKSWLPAVAVEVPVDVLLPVHMVVPIDAQIPVTLDVQVSGALPATIRVPLDAQFDVRPAIKGDITARVLSLTDFKLMAPSEPFPLTIEQADLRVPFNLTLLRQRQF